MEDDESTVSSEPLIPDDESGEIRSVDLLDGRRLIVRYAGKDDVAAVQTLYGRLSVDDLRLRFFVGHVPLDHTTMLWVTVGERGGVALVAEVIESDGSRLVIAEAGYALLDDGDGELAIAVDPRWRGWLGAWLLDVLTHEAAERGVANLQAVVLVRNRTMLAMLRHRGYAAVEHSDWDQIRLVISTESHTPSWPTHTSRPRLLAVSPGARWSGEALAREAGFEIRTCPGPSGLDGSCPAIAGRPCPLLDGADAVVFDLVPSTQGGAELVENLHGRQIPVVVTRTPLDGPERSPCGSVSDIIDQIVDQLAERAPDPSQ